MVLVRPQNAKSRGYHSKKVLLLSKGGLKLFHTLFCSKCDMIQIIQQFIPMRKVHPGDVHPVLNEFEEGGGLPGNWADGADNARQPHLVCRAVHVQIRHKLHLEDAINIVD